MQPKGSVYCKYTVTIGQVNIIEYVKIAVMLYKILEIIVFK